MFLGLYLSRAVFWVFPENSVDPVLVGGAALDCRPARGVWAHSDDGGDDDDVDDDDDDKTE